MRNVLEVVHISCVCVLTLTLNGNPNSFKEVRAGDCEAAGSSSKGREGETEICKEKRGNISLQAKGG